MGDRERMLRRITLGDANLLTGPDPSWEPGGVPALDARSRALVRLGALLASDPTPATLQNGITVAIGAEVTSDECVAALVELLPTIGLPRAAAVAPKLGLAIGYDVDAALETMSDDRAGRRWREWMPLDHGDPTWAANAPPCPIMATPTASTDPRRPSISSPPDEERSTSDGHDTERDDRTHRPDVSP